MPSHRPGMGAIVYGGGVAFRVWAPFAERVAVAGTFNGWSETNTPLDRGGHGYWSGDVPGARAGDEYEFIVVNGGVLKRTDPTRVTSRARPGSASSSTRGSRGAPRTTAPPHGTSS